MIRVLTNYMSINVFNTDRNVLFYSVNIHRYITPLSLILGLLLCSSLVSSYPIVLAQSSNGGVGAGSTNQYQGGQGMILEKISDKGNYRVQIMWNQLGSQSANAVPSGNATSSPTIPKKESGIKSESPVGASVNQIPTPSIIQTTVPVDSYDITIYSDHGQELWKKLNQPVTAGRGVQRVIFENSNYTGGITIQITNIK